MNTLTIEPLNRMQTRSTLSLAGALSAACLFAGFGGSFASLFAPDFLGYAPLVVGLSTILIVWLLRRLRFAPRILTGLLVLSAAIGVWQFDLIDGLLSIINRVSTVLGANLGQNLTRYAASASGESFALLLLTALLALSCVWLVRIRSVLIASLLVLPVLALNLLLGMAAGPVWISFMFAGVLLLHLPEILLTRDSRSGLTAWLGMAVLGTLICFGFTILLNNMDTTAVSALRAELLDRIEIARFGESELTGGDFSDLDVLEPSSEPMLEITMSEPESLYLRGFIGSEYHADGWHKAENVSLSDGADLFYWLHQDDFYGQTQLADAAMLLEGNIQPEDCIEISVKHLGANRKYVYAPYELVYSDLLNPAEIGDVQLKSGSLTGSDSYSIISAPNQVKRYNYLVSLLQQAESAPAEELESYLLNESHYNAFVYSHFLALPEENLKCIASLLGAADFKGNPHLDYGEAKQRILEWLDANITYRETTPPRLRGTDFLHEFLELNKAGYDVHYASAAVAMMRYFGIPARYVEGYLITPDDAENAEGGVPFTLSGERAHAWCEIYQDGIGWIPFEVTPKYLNLMEQADVLRSAGPSQDTPPQESEEQPMEENSLDMEEDFHDDFEDEEDPDDNPLPLTWLAYAALSLLILLLLMLLILWLSSRISIRRLNRSLRLSDRKKAVGNLYAYLFVLMRELYGWKDCIAPSAFLENVRADQGEDAAIKYKQIIEICEEAAFDVHGVLEEDYWFVYNFVRKTRILLKKRLKLFRKLKLRYIRHII